MTRWELSHRIPRLFLAVTLLLLGSFGPGEGSDSLEPAASTSSDLLTERRNVASALEAAAIEFDVPLRLLQATAWVRSRWLQEASPSAAGATVYCGIMGFREDGSYPSLAEAAALIGENPETLRSDFRTNIRGGAALLADRARRERNSGVRVDERLETWRTVLETFMGIPSPDRNDVSADEVLKVMREGHSEPGIRIDPLPGLGAGVPAGTTAGPEGAPSPGEAPGPAEEGPAPDPAPFLSFPLPNRAPETALIASVFDHYMVTPYEAGGIQITTYQGETARSECGGKLDLPRRAYALYDPESGACPAGKPSMERYSGGEFLHDDNHPGYDFSTSDIDPGEKGRVAVFAAASGRVITTSEGLVSSGFESPGVDFDARLNGDTNLEALGAVLIFPDPPFDQYAVGYLRLDPASIRSDRGQETRVRKGDLIGFTEAGSQDLQAPHLHFEVRKKIRVDGVPVYVPVDPYGWLGMGEDPYFLLNPLYPSNINGPLWEKCTDQFEPNDRPESAFGPLSPDSSLSGKLCSPTDEDYYSLELKENERVRITLASPPAVLNDYRFEIDDSLLAKVAGSVRGLDQDEVLDFTAPGAGVYYLRIFGPGGNFNSSASYSLSLERLPAQDASLADLIGTAVSNPPATLRPGTRFSATDTAKNQGASPSRETATRYYLSLDSRRDGADIPLEGSRAVASLAAGSISTGTADLAVPPSAPAGTYFLLACVDDPDSVQESIEGNNCVASAEASQLQVTLPDLLEENVSVITPSQTFSPGMSIAVQETVRNQGTVIAPFSITQYYFSTDSQQITNGRPLVGSRSVPRLAPEGTSTGTMDLLIPTNVAPGSYFLFACADARTAIGESDDSNNCSAAADQVLVALPDLVGVSLTLTNPTVKAVPGQSLIIEDEVKNAGSGTSGRSTTRYYLINDTREPVLLKETRALPGLAAGSSLREKLGLTIPPGIPEGSYLLRACADDTKLVSEVNETNNCLAAVEQVQVVLGDLVVSLRVVPTSASPGTDLVIEDTVQNQGDGPVGSSTTRYYLRKDSGNILLPGGRVVPGLAAGESSPGKAVVTLPVGTPPPAPPAPGYFLLSCANDTRVVREHLDDYANNCTVSTNPIQILLTDLIQVSVTDPPAEVAAGQGFSITDVIRNDGSAASGTSETRYYLSLSSGAQRNLLDIYVGRRAVESLQPGETSEGTGDVRIPDTVRPGKYHLRSCADGPSLIQESSDDNNCLASANTVEVLQPDLLETEANFQPASLSPGDVLLVTDRVENGGEVPAGSTTTRFYLSLSGDGLKHPGDILIGSRNIPTLDGPEGSSTATTAITLPISGLSGSYFLLVCADDRQIVTESDEGNNCLASSSTVEVVVDSDLTETSVSFTPAFAAPGTMLSVSDTLKNQGLVASGRSTTRFYLSKGTQTDLIGERLAGGLLPGGTSPGTTPITLPLSTAAGDYFLLACANDARTVSETDLTNNCLQSASQVSIVLADLVVTSISEPPAVTGPGNPISVSDTVRNIGDGASVSSTVRYYLSPDAVRDAGDLLLGGRAVAGLPPAEESDGSATPTIPLSTPEGSYFLLACANDTLSVPESDTSNNCRASTGQVQVLRTNLVVTFVSNPPSTAAPGSGFTVTDTVRNIGPSGAPGSTTQYYLSLDAQKDLTDAPLSGTRSVPSLDAGTDSSGPASLTVQLATPAGTYFLLACADATGAVPESNEEDNCLPASVKIQVLLSDLQVTSLSDPPAIAGPGTSFVVLETTKNIGTLASTSSVTNYYLSSDVVRDARDILLTRARVVAGLPPSGESPGSAAPTVPLSTPQGNYFLLACANATGSVPESDASNNCLPSTGQVQVLRTDLVVTSLFDPPSTVVAGNSFTVTDTVRNSGDSGSPSSITQYYFSRDDKRDSADLRLTGSRSVPPLDAGKDSSGPASLTVPLATPAGTYFLLACADSTGVVPESDEADNCFAATGKVEVKPPLPDLVVSFLQDPLSSIPAGKSISISFAIQNQGYAAAGSSKTGFYLSKDPAKSLRERSLASVSATGLAAAENRTATLTATVPLTTPAEIFFVVACADDSSAVSEISETNNCRVSSTAVGVLQPDLVESLDSVPPLTVMTGSSLPVTDTVSNRGDAPSIASTTRYYLSADLVIDSTDIMLQGSRAVAPLAVLAQSKGSATVTIPTTTPSGEYYLAACADDKGAVVETDDSNNCSSPKGTIQVQSSLPDLVETLLSDPPLAAAAGISFRITDTVKNQGSVAAPASTTRYYLSNDTRRDFGDTPLQGSRILPGLAKLATSTGSASLTVPSGTPSGTYHLLACADDGGPDNPGVLVEISESNNCLASTGRVQVRLADLLAIPVTNPPETVAAGKSFSVTDKSQNLGPGSSPRSTTRYYLSADALRSAGDRPLTPSRSIGVLAAGTASTGTLALSVPGTTPAGFYFLLACADDAGAVVEADEVNNCQVSARQVQVVSADLLVTSLTDPPGGSLAAGKSFSVTDTVQNQGPGPSGASTVRYYLSTDPHEKSMGGPLTGTRSVPSLTPQGMTGSTSKGTASVTIPRGTLAGIYFLLACADDAGAVTESNEANNCLA